MQLISRFCPKKSVNCERLEISHDSLSHRENFAKTNLWNGTISIKSEYKNDDENKTKKAKPKGSERESTANKLQWNECFVNFEIHARRNFREPRNGVATAELSKGLLGRNLNKGSNLRCVQKYFEIFTRNIVISAFERPVGPALPVATGHSGRLTAGRSTGNILHTKRGMEHPAYYEDT